MAFMFNARQPVSVSTRVRSEAYAGLLLLLFALTVLAFNHCPSPDAARFSSRPPGQPFELSGTSVPPPHVSYGSAGSDGSAARGWWVGHFAPRDSMRSSRAVETKWAVHSSGAVHPGWTVNQVATSMAVLLAGKHRIEFEHAAVVLEFPGDYVIWGPGVAHSWTALHASTVLTVRWPSVPDDQPTSPVLSASPSLQPNTSVSRIAPTSLTVHVASQKHPFHAPLSQHVRKNSPGATQSQQNAPSKRFEKHLTNGMTAERVKTVISTPVAVHSTTSTQAHPPSSPTKSHPVAKQSSPMNSSRAARTSSAHNSATFATNITPYYSPTKNNNALSTTQ